MANFAALTRARCSSINKLNRLPASFLGTAFGSIDGHNVYDFDLGGAVYSLGEYFSVPATGGVAAPDGRARPLGR